MILCIDNYDSFVHNLCRYLQQLGQQVAVRRNDEISSQGIRSMRPDAIVISPGPCAPDQAGQTLNVIKEYCREIPILGVCLGHQAIGQAFGGRVSRAPFPMHGCSSLVYHRGGFPFASVPSPFSACRYHSLIVERATLPDCLEITAETAEGLIMGLKHREYPVVGLQFHPESILTQFGYQLLANFLAGIGLEVLSEIPTCGPQIIERNTEPTEQMDNPRLPITF